MTDAAPVTFTMAAPHIGLATLNRPEARNAINGDVAQALGKILTETESNPDVWAVILTGAGGQVFSAGADLKEIAAGRIAGLSTPGGGFAGFVHAKRTKPWIAAVDGLALAGGFEIVLACDFIVASDISAFALPEVKRGLTAAAGGTYRLPRALPKAIAFEMIATGERLSVADAKAYGLVNRVAPKGQAVAEALKLATSICENAPIAVRESLKVARAAYDLDDAGLQEISNETQRAIAKTEDFQEGPRAFVEKRPAVWKGR
jgi:enoyl-CoA hydratase/carnithine racemase